MEQTILYLIMMLCFICKSTLLFFCSPPITQKTCIIDYLSSFELKISVEIVHRVTMNLKFFQIIVNANLASRMEKKKQDFYQNHIFVVKKTP